MLLRNVVAATFTSAVAITYSLSYGALIFSGPLAPQLSRGIGMMLITAAVSGIVVALTSTFRFAIAGADSNATAVLAVVAAALAEALPHDPALAARHVVIALMLSGIAGGLVLVALGRFRMGRWVRFIPYPIVAGFLAATGWLLVIGALRVIAGVSLPAHLAPAFTPSGAARLAAGVGFAAVLFATRKIRNPVVLPALLICASAAIDLGFALTGRLGVARAEGWLVPAFGRPELASALDPRAYAGISWPLIGSLTPAIATAITVTVIAILFGAAGLEAQTGIDADLDRELRSSGIASIASGLCGGSLGSLSGSRSTINLNAGATTRFPGVFVGVASAAALFGGSAIVSQIPEPVLGGLLLFMGAVLLYEWLATAWSRLSKVDLLLVVTIVAVTAVSSFLDALIVGLLFACVNFAIRYGRFSVIRHALSAASRRSRVERSAAERALLDAHGDEIRILILQGYVYFGTANSLLERARAFLVAPARAPRYLILDFDAVTGLDSSAAHSFARLVALARRAGTTVIYCALSAPAATLLGRAGEGAASDGAPEPHVDLDRALEACEDQLLADLTAREPEAPEAWLGRELGGAHHASALLRYFDEIRIAAGASLFHQGDPSDALYLVVAGRLRVTIDESDAGHRLRLMSPGSFIGEMGLFTGEPRSAAVVAEEDAVLYRLSDEALTRMNEEPALVRAFHGLIFRLQADRLRFASAEIAALES